MSTKSFPSRHCPRSDCSYRSDWNGDAASLETSNDHPRSTRVRSFREGTNDGEMGHGEF